MKAYVFPGQGAQFVGMGKDIYDSSPLAKRLFEQANDILGFNITALMFDGTDEDLRRTDVTQPAIFIHSVASEMVAIEHGAPSPEMVAGHSLGEYSALVACGALDFADALRLVNIRAKAMQKACEINKGTMAAVLKMSDETVEEACAAVKDAVVVAANYNCPGQIVISGSEEGVDKATEVLAGLGARRVIRLNVGGAFHSPLMQPAADELQQAIDATPFVTPICPVYQNVNALPQTDPQAIRHNLIAQLTSPVRWTRTVLNMIADGADSFREFGPGEVLRGLVRKINPQVEIL